MAQLDSRVYYNYYDKANDSTTVSYAAGQSRAATARPRRCHQRDLLHHRGADREPASFRLHEERGRIRSHLGVQPRQKLLGGFDLAQASTATLEPRRPKPTTTVTGSSTGTHGWENLSGRLKYEFLQRVGPRSSFTNNGDDARRPYYFTAYDVNNFDQNMVKLSSTGRRRRCGSSASARRGARPTTRTTSTAGTRTRASSTTRRRRGAIVDKLRITGIGNWGKIEYNQAYPGRDYPAAVGTQHLPRITLGHEEHPGRLDARRAGRLGGDRQADADRRRIATRRPPAASTSIRATRRRRRLHSGGPLVNYVTDNTEAAALPDQGQLQRQQAWSVNGRLRVREVRLQRRPDGGLRGYYPYFQHT